MELLLSLAGIVISLIIAWWEYRRANEAEALLNKTFNQLPQQIVDDLVQVLESAEFKSSDDDSTTIVTRHADLNGDGRNELLVSFLSGARNTALKVYGLKSHWNFGLLGELNSTTPTDFHLEDVNGDGVPEVTAVEVAKEPDLPYVMGLRDRVSYKLTDHGFVEVKRAKCYSPEELEEALQDWHSNDSD